MLGVKEVFAWVGQAVGAMAYAPDHPRVDKIVDREYFVATAKSCVGEVDIDMIAAQ